MEKLTFKRQLIFGIVLIIAGNILAFASHNGVFSNIAWIIYGLLCILHPVYPDRYGCDRKKAILGARIAGIICIVVGLMTRFVP